MYLFFKKICGIWTTNNEVSNNLLRTTVMTFHLPFELLANHLHWCTLSSFYILKCLVIFSRLCPSNLVLKRGEIFICCIITWIITISLVLVTVHPPCLLSTTICRYWRLSNDFPNEVCLVVHNQFWCCPVVLGAVNNLYPILLPIHASQLLCKMLNTK